MAYQFRYRLESITARKDGSATVSHDIWGEYREESSGDPWENVGVHKDVVIPAADLQAALAAGGQGAIVAAYKNAIVDNRNTTPVPINGMTLEEMQARVAANDEAGAAYDAAVSFITDTLGLEFPVSFTL